MAFNLLGIMNSVLNSQMVKGLKDTSKNVNEVKNEVKNVSNTTEDIAENTAGTVASQAVASAITSNNVAKDAQAISGESYEDVNLALREADYKKAQALNAKKAKDFELDGTIYKPEEQAVFFNPSSTGKPYKDRQYTADQFVNNPSSFGSKSNPESKPNSLWGLRAAAQKAQEAYAAGTKKKEWMATIKSNLNGGNK